MDDFGVRCRANVAQTRQSRPDAGLGFLSKVIPTFKLFALCSEADTRGVQDLFITLLSMGEVRCRANVAKIRQSRPDAGLDCLTPGTRDLFITLLPNLRRFKGFNLKAMAGIWPWLSYLCHIRRCKTTIHHPSLRGRGPLPSEFSTYKTVTARCWP